jgi:hypothetical protein
MAVVYALVVDGSREEDRRRGCDDSGSIRFGSRGQQRREERM